MKYKVYNKYGNQKDVIMTLNTINLERAIEYASSIKKISEEKFIKLFIVKEV